MKKILVEYFNILAYVITGLVFALASFILIINIYHYKEVNDVYIKQESDYEINNQLKEKINNIKSNISNLPSSNNPNYIAYSSVQTKLNICSQKIDINQIDKILMKDNITINDVYDMQQFYKYNIANECLIKQLYILIDEEDNTINNISSFKAIKPFIKDNINELKNTSDYTERILKSNSSYKFTSNSTKISIYNEVKDSYYKIINDYVDSINFLYDLTVWYKNEVGGNI